MNTLQRVVVGLFLVASLTAEAVAADCIVLGDSIAVGVGQWLPRCASLAKVGRPTLQIISNAPVGNYDIAIVSAGSNDGERASLESLRTLRSYILARKIVWIIPSSKFKAAAFVQAVAQEYGDRTIGFGTVISSDNVHPTGTGYRLLAATLSDFYRL